MKKPLYTEHHRDLKTVIESVLYTDVLPRLAYFTSKACSRVFGYSEIDPKIFQEAGVWRRKNLKTMYLMISCLYDNLEATDWPVFAMREKANQGSGMLLLRFILILTVRKRWLAMCN